MIKAYLNFVQVLKEEKPGILATHASTDDIVGKVISVGSEVKNIKKGDTIQFNRNKSLSAAYGGKQYYYVKDESILAYEQTSK